MASPRRNPQHAPRNQHTTPVKGGAAPMSFNARGQNINHLLAFTLPPRAQPSAVSARRPRRSRGGVVFNKERYVNAQYRFLVKPTSDYTVYFADADIYLNWADILIVLIPTTSALSSVSSSPAGPAAEYEGSTCPICLSPPTAPRMTKCGHVFCYPCILHYLAVSDAAPAASGRAAATPYHQHAPPGSAIASAASSAEAKAAPSNRWKRCPICWDAVYPRDLKAVKWWDAKAVAVEHLRTEEELVAGAAAAPADALPRSAERDVPAETTKDGGGSTVQPGEVMCMRLVERPLYTTLALPQSSTWPHASSTSSPAAAAAAAASSPFEQALIPQNQAPWHFQPDVMPFAKFMLATPELLLQRLSDDLEQLESERALLTSLGGGDELSVGFVSIAEQKVREQVARVREELDTPAVRSAIGQARNDLKEHAEMLENRAGFAGAVGGEQLSRRQRRRRERERKHEGEAEGDATGEVGEAEGGSSEADGTTAAVAVGSVGGAAQEVSAEVADWLAVKSQAQGQGGVRLGGAGAGVGGSSSPSKDDGKGGNPSSSPVTSELARSPPVPKAQRNINPPQHSPSSYLFYQAASGQNIYLHPLDIKVLLAEYGTYSAFPRTLRLRAQGADEGSMNEELRKRCKYLAHLPQGADVVFVEADWHSMAAESERRGERAAVSRATLRPYEQALRQRKHRRRDRERRDDRAKLRAEEAEALASASRGGHGGAAMERHRRAALASMAEDPQLSAASYGTSLGSSASTSAQHHQQQQPGDTAAGASAGAGGTAVASPSFREAALWGAEREFPIHPGAEAEEDFPDILGGGPAGGDRGQALGEDAVGGGDGGRRRRGHTSQPVAIPAPGARTVWGTPAVAAVTTSGGEGMGRRRGSGAAGGPRLRTGASFASALHRRGGGDSEQRAGDWDDEADEETAAYYYRRDGATRHHDDDVGPDWDAWLELEEEVLDGVGGVGYGGGGGAGGVGAVKKLASAGREGRGPNRQPPPRWLGGAGSGGGESRSGSGSGTPTRRGASSGQATPTRAANATKAHSASAGSGDAGGATPTGAVGEAGAGGTSEDKDATKPTTATTAAAPTPTKPAKRKPRKLVLTSSGRGMA